MILKPALGAVDVGDSASVADAAGEDGELVDAEGADELVLAWTEHGRDRLALVECCDRTESIPSRWMRCSRARTESSAEGWQVREVLERVMQWVARSSWWSS